MRADTLEQGPATAGGETGIAVSVTGLAKTFGEIEAVKGVTFDVGAGEIFAFLGPNGAGKSTTIKMLCTLLRPTAGHATVAGHDVAREPKAARAHIGLVFQERTLDEQLTAEENLAFHGALYGIPRREIAERSRRVLDMVSLSDRAGDLVSTFSGGMARRLEIARGLMHTPTVLFLDEPTIGLDPQTRARIWEDVRRLRDEHGVTVFMTTHYMDEAEYADRIAIIDRGTIVAMGSPEELKASVGLDTVLLATGDDRTAAARLRESGYDLDITSEGVLVRTADGETEVPALLSRAGVPVRLVRVRRPTLDDVFLHYTGREMRSDSEGSSMIRQIIAARRGR